MSAPWKPVKLEARVGLSKLVVEATPKGWRWVAITGSRVGEGTADTQREAMLAAENAALGLAVRSC